MVGREGGGVPTRARPTLKNLCCSSSVAVGRMAGSFCRQRATTSRMCLLKCRCPLLSSRLGGGFCSVISSTFIGGNLAKGAWPLASSSIVMPRDQMSADES